MDILQNTNFFSAFTTSAEFTLDADLLYSALGITLKDYAHPFVAPPAGDLVIDFVNNLGYPKELQFVSKMYMNSLYQPWRTIMSMINQCLTDKTSGVRHNIHKWPQSPLHITADDYSLSNLKFVPKGKLDEVFIMLIPKDLITDVIRNSKYYQNYLEITSRKPRQANIVTDEEGGKKKKAPPAEKTSKPSPSKKVRKGKVMKVRKGKRSDHLVVEEDEEGQLAPEPHVKDDEYNLQRDVETGADMEKSNSEADTEILNVEEEQGEDISNMVALVERTVELNEGQARSDPENPLSSSETLSSIKNLDDAFTFGDQFLNDKPSEEEPGKDNVETENQDLYLKIDKYINKAVKEVVHNALQAPIRERFRDLSRFEMKEILRDRMFESGSYRSHLEHTALYDALELSMDRENKEDFNEATAKSRMRHHDG
ncbi:hypothetical protein Tco_1014652 [Tanacetum coccineum]